MVLTSLSVTICLSALIKLVTISVPSFAGSGDSANSALAFGGGTPSVTNATEEWTAADFLIKTVTTS